MEMTSQESFHRVSARSTMISNPFRMLIAMSSHLQLVSCGAAVAMTVPVAYRIRQTLGSALLLPDERSANHHTDSVHE